MRSTFGFISVQEIEGLGHCGGLLVVSQIGRPIEFHCSAPVVTNRAQKILYGKTYDNYLYCEQIGLALIDKAKNKPQLYLADCGQLLGLDELTSEMVVVLESESNQHVLADQLGQRAISTAIDGHRIWCPLRLSDDIQIVQDYCESFTKSLPLEEPFERIRTAIDEAQAVAR